MLIIRDEQIELLRQQPRIRFENRLIRHCYEFYTEECDRLGKKQVRRVVRFGLKQMLSQGYTTQRDATYFISLMFLFGSYFYCDPQLPWCSGETGTQPLSDRVGQIQDVYQTAITYLEKTAGDDNRFLIKALIRIYDFDMSRLPESLGDEFPQELCALMEYFYPEKFAYQGSDITLSVVHDAIFKARGYGIKSVEGLATYVTLVFILGDRFGKDLLNPWAVTVLDDPTLTAPDSRATLLLKEARKYLRMVLSSKERGTENHE